MKPKIQFIYDTAPDTECDIQAFMSCAKCLAERPADTSPAKFARLNFGITPDGFQLWCVRHDCNVALIQPRIKPKKEPAGERRLI